MKFLNKKKYTKLLVITGEVNTHSSEDQYSTNRTKAILLITHSKEIGNGKTYQIIQVKYVSQYSGHVRCVLYHLCY